MWYPKPLSLVNVKKKKVKNDVLQYLLSSGNITKHTKFLCTACNDKVNSILSKYVNAIPEMNLDADAEVSGSYCCSPD